jgi:hypothetical protein
MSGLVAHSHVQRHAVAPWILATGPGFAVDQANAEVVAHDEPTVPVASRLVNGSRLLAAEELVEVVGTDAPLHAPTLIAGASAPDLFGRAVAVHHHASLDVGHRRPTVSG